MAFVLRVGKYDPLPKMYKGRKVISGDIHDLRFLDGVNKAVALTPKGNAFYDTSGFVLDIPAAA